jgi:hypothetical protein
MQNKADKDEIPTKLSELENDAGYITEGDIPSKTSDLVNDSGFITKEVDNLTNYTDTETLNTDLGLINGDISDINTDIQNLQDAIDLQLPNRIGDIVVDSIRSKNMCNIYASQLEASISGTDGSIVTAQNNACGTNYISVKPNTTYIISANTTFSALRLSEYSSQKVHIQRIAQNNVRSLTITTSANTCYLRWSININNTTTTIAKIEALNLQLETGSTVTPYKPYQNLNGMETYSTTETVIGTWINGKPLYRKVVKYVSTISPGWSGVSFSTLGLSNIEYLRIPSALGKSGNQYEEMVSNQNRIIINIGNSTLSLYLTDGSFSEITFILEYTKTTD